MSAETSADSAGPGGWRAVLRALAIALVLFVQFVQATPYEPFDQERLQRPEGVRAVSVVGGGLALIGRAAPHEEIREELIALTQRLIALRNATLAPFQPFFDVTATHQQWGLFITPKRECFRVVVDARLRGGRWVDLFRAHQLERSELSFLRYRRLRAIYNPRLKQGPSAQYPSLVSWLARRLLAEHPDYDAVRMRMDRVSIGEPGSTVREIGQEYVELRERPAP